MVEDGGVAVKPTMVVGLERGASTLEGVIGCYTRGGSGGFVKTPGVSRSFGPYKVRKDINDAAMKYFHLASGGGPEAVLWWEEGRRGGGGY